MSFIDPARVRGFSDAVGAARTHVDGALEALDAIRAGNGDAASLVDAADMQLGFMAGTLRDARAQVHTREASDAVLELSETGVRQADSMLAPLRRAIAESGDVSSAAEAAHTRLAAAADYYFEGITRTATTTSAAEDAALGAAGVRGEWQSLRELADQELMAASNQVDEEIRGLAEQVDEIESGARSADELDPSRWDEEIAAHDLSRALDSPDALDELRRGTPDATARAEGDLADLRAGTRGRLQPVGNQQVSPAPELVTGSQATLDTAPAAGDPVITLTVWSRHTRTDEPLPLLATGKVYDDLPNLHQAQAFASRLDGWWVAMPQPDGRHRVVEVGLGPDTEHVDGAIRALHAEAGQVDGLAVPGRWYPTPYTDVDATAARAAARLDGEFLGVFDEQWLPPGTDGVPSAGDALVTLTIPGRLLGKDRTITALAAPRDSQRVVSGMREDVLQYFTEDLRSAGQGSIRAMVRTSAGRYTAIPVAADGLDASRVLRALQPGHETPTNAGFSYDVEALIVTGKRGAVSGADLKTGELFDTPPWR